GATNRDRKTDLYTIHHRTGAVLPSLPYKRLLLIHTRQRGYARENGDVTPGFASIAAVIRSGTLLTSVAITWPTDDPAASDAPVAALLDTAELIKGRLR